ncbi:MAG: M15 family metallopeptidase [Bdellovibrionales bacterium]
MSHADAQSSLKFVLQSADFVELQNAADLIIDLRYASQNNFAGINLYGPFNRAFLHKITAQKLSLARENIQRTKPGYKLIIFDALRPRSIQRVLWDLVAGTEGEKYFANPDLGSLHSFGFAVDLSLLDEIGKELDMGAGFDDFRDIAQPKFEERFLRDGTLSPMHIANRRLLRNAMESAGFTQLPNEWWHFDALPKAQVRANFPIVE